MGCCAPKEDHKEQRRKSSNQQTRDSNPPQRPMKMSESELKEKIQLIFNRYDSNNDGILQFDEVEKVLDDGRPTRRRLGSDQATIENYIEAYMQSTQHKQDGRLQKKAFYKYYRVNY